MAITFGSGQSVAASATTTLSPSYPAGITAGHLLVLSIANKYPAAPPVTPAGWSLVASASGGAGSPGTNLGTVLVSMYVRIADGTETGSLAVSIPSNNIALGVISRMTKSTSLNWDVAGTGGALNVGGSVSWSVTCDSDPAIRAGDYVLAASGINSSVFTYTSEALTAAGITAMGVEVELDDTSNSGGDRLRIVYSGHPVTTGASTAAPVYTMTASSSGTNVPAGATVLLRLRERPSMAGSMGPGIGLGLNLDLK